MTSATVLRLNSLNSSAGISTARLDAASSLFDQSLINHFSGFTDSLKAQFIVIDLDQHEMVVQVS
jgi:hypothetical protein